MKSTFVLYLQFFFNLSFADIFHAPQVLHQYPRLSFFNISMLVKCSWIFTGCTNSKRLRNLTQSHNHMTRATPGTMSSFEIRDHCFFFKGWVASFPLFTHKTVSLLFHGSPLLICQLKQSPRNAAFFKPPFRCILGTFCDFSDSRPLNTFATGRNGPCQDHFIHLCQADFAWPQGLSPGPH